MLTAQARLNNAALHSSASKAERSAESSQDQARPVRRRPVTPAQASQLTPDQVQHIAAHASQQDPSIGDGVGSFYGEHPQPVKSLGARALAIVLGKMARLEFCSTINQETRS